MIKFLVDFGWIALMILSFLIVISERGKTIEALENEIRNLRKPKKYCACGELMNHDEICPLEGE